MSISPVSLTLHWRSVVVFHHTQGLIFHSQPAGDAAGGAAYNDLHMQLLHVIWMHDGQEVEIKE